MFSFHKPKVYRSSTGCCICKAKSSSSRFTDSKKYEEDFMKCFELEERRSGEICNACVLLVKRWKKLPVGSSRNWRHVVDARAGPGIKSLTKFKAKNKKKSKETKEVEKFDKILKKKHVYLKNDREREQSPAMSDDLTDEYLAGNGSKGSSRAGSPAGSDDTAVGEKRLNIDQGELEISSFIDLTYFKRKNVCCGSIFVGMMGEVIIEPAYFKPCAGCLARQQRQREAAAVVAAGAGPAHSTSSAASAGPCHSSASTSPAHGVESGTEGGGNNKPKGFCDSSSDSGYGDSNHGMMMTEIMKSHQLPSKQQPPKAAHSPRMIAKPAKPVVKMHQQTLPVATTLRLTTSSGATTKVPIKLLCKPVALVSSAKLSLSGAGSVSARSVDTTTATTTVLTVPPSAVDFAVRPSPHRQSLSN